jgi:membrane fusion protein (multidrug efflux system)
MNIETPINTNGKSDRLTEIDHLAIHRHDARVAAKDDSTAATADQALHSEQPTAPTDALLTTSAPEPSAAKPTAHRRRKWLLLAAAVVGLSVGGYIFAPSVNTALNTVSTDDAYVNGHVTLVAPRVSGQVTGVLVDDNCRVKKGDVLVQLDKEPYEVQVAIKKAAVISAEADLAAANAQVRGEIAQARANRFMLQNSIENVNTEKANLAAAVATLTRAKASLALALSNLKRGEDLAPSGAMSAEDLDVRRQTAKVDEAAVNEALQRVYAIRVSLGLPAQPPTGQDLADVPLNLEQNVSSVQQNLGT